MGPRIIVSSDRFEKPGIKYANPELQGEWHYNCAMEASTGR